jgi:hypothetical protein
MIKTKKYYHYAALSMALILTACVPPQTFVKTLEPAWASVEIRTDLSYGQAWEAVLDTLVKRFDVEVMSRQDGYMRTSWLYTWTGTVNENYRVRVTVKFSQDHKKIEVKSEAEFGGPGRWVMGYDTRLLETIKTDIMGTLGRTTR